MYGLVEEPLTLVYRLNAEDTSIHKEKETTQKARINDTEKLRDMKQQC